MSDNMENGARHTAASEHHQNSTHASQRNNNDRPAVAGHTHAIDMRDTNGTRAALDDTSNDDTYNADRDTTIHPVNILPSFLSSRKHAQLHSVNRQKHSQSVTADTDELQGNMHTRVDLVDKQSVNRYTKKPLTHIPFFSQLQLGRHTYKFRHSQFARNTEFAVRASLGFVIAAFLLYSTNIGNLLNPGYLVIIIATLTQGPSLGQTLSIVQLIVMTLTPVVIFCYIVQLIGLGYEQYAATAVLIFVTSFYIGTRNSNVQSRKFGLLFPSIFFTTVIATPALPATFAWTLYATFLLGLALSLATSLFILPHYAFIELDSRFSYGCAQCGPTECTIADRILLYRAGRGSVDYGRGRHYTSVPARQSDADASVGQGVQLRTAQLFAVVLPATQDDNTRVRDHPLRRLLKVGNQAPAQSLAELAYKQHTQY